MQNRAEFIENIVKKREKSQETDESGLDYEEFEDEDVEDEDFDEYAELPPEPKQTNPFEERQAALEDIYESHDLHEAKERIKEAEQAEKDLETAEDLVAEAEWAAEQKKLDEEEARDFNRLDENDPARDVLDRLTEDGIDIETIDLNKVENRGLGSSGDPMDYRTYLRAAKEVVERQEAVKKNPSLGHIFDSEDLRLKIDQNQQNEMADDNFRLNSEQAVSEMDTSRLSIDQINILLDQEDSEIANSPFLRARVFEEYSKLVDLGEPAERWSTMRKAIERIDTRDAIETMAERRGQTFLT